MSTNAAAKTQRDPHGMWVGTGAVRQHDGKLPLYLCNTCGADVVWATSQRTGRKYLANVARGAHDTRFYIAASIHDCGPRLRMREERERTEEANNAARYLLHLIEQHEEGAHEAAPAEGIAGCLYCERDYDRAAGYDQHLRHEGRAR